MDDNIIVELFWNRKESALSAVAEKYGGFCYSIAHNILHNKEDSDECVNDTYLAAWNSIPPHKPDVLSAFLGRITRNQSINKWRAKNAEKRGGGQVDVILDELMECIPSNSSVDDQIQTKELSEIIDSFLRKLPKAERQVFVRRYWYFDSITNISVMFNFGQSKVKMMLLRTRDKLLAELNKGGYNV